MSHLHGRMRRAERGIDRTELKRAVKYGKRSHANPGRNGQPRWKYVHNDIVYITDETSRHEITSWRTRDDDAEEEDEAGELNDDVTVGATGTHVVIIVDDSGSMRTNDIPGYEHRKQAVYNCLKKDFFLPQVATAGDAKVSTHGEVFASLIRFNDEATVIFERVQADKEVSKKVMLNKLDKERNKRARSHGNYLPALRAADELLAKDSRSFARLMVLLLSDGAPSDHQEMECKHGTMVWRSFGESLGKVSFIECPTGGRRCRWLVKDREQRECVEWAKKLATKYGEDRVVITTVAFGDPKQNFSTLEKMTRSYVGLPLWKHHESIGHFSLGHGQSRASNTCGCSCVAGQPCSFPLAVRKTPPGSASRSRTSCIAAAATTTKSSVIPAQSSASTDLGCVAMTARESGSRRGKPLADMPRAAAAKIPAPASTMATQVVVVWLAPIASERRREGESLRNEIKLTT